MTKQRRTFSQEFKQEAVALVAITGPWDDFQVGVTKVGLAATLFRWYMGLIYVPYKWLSGERFPADGLTTCFNATDWELPSDLD